MAVVNIGITMYSGSKAGQLPVTQVITDPVTPLVTAPAAVVAESAASPCAPRRSVFSKFQAAMVLDSAATDAFPPRRSAAGRKSRRSLSRRRRPRGVGGIFFAALAVVAISRRQCGWKRRAVRPRLGCRQPAAPGNAAGAHRPIIARPARVAAPRRSSEPLGINILKYIRAHKTATGGYATQFVG